MEDIIGSEESDGRRILSQNGSAVAFIPYFARYAYETFVVPRRPHARAWPTCLARSCAIWPRCCTRS